MELYRDENDGVDNASKGKSFEFKTKITGKTPAWLSPNPDGSRPSWPPQPSRSTLNIQVTIPLKYLSNFWRSLEMPLINCEVELDLLRPKMEHHNSIIDGTS